MAKIKDIHVRHFKGLREVDLLGCGPINVLVGKNNAGKSSVLHAIDMAGLALNRGNWSEFEWKLEMKHLFDDAGPFRVEFVFDDGSSKVVLRQEGAESPHFPQGYSREETGLKTVLISENASFGPQSRQHFSPRQVMEGIQSRNYSRYTGLDMLYALRYHAERGLRDFRSNDFQELKDEIRRFFPDLDDVQSDRTDNDISTLTYRENGKDLDILYSGTGLKQFIDILVKTKLSGANVVLVDEADAGLHPQLQRELIQFLKRYSQERNIQFFLTTHSPVFLRPDEDLTVYRMKNQRGIRIAVSVPKATLHDALSDLGLRPSDLLQNDIVVLVEGATDVIFFEVVMERFWRQQLSGLSVAVQQFGGDAANGINSNRINVGNITNLNPYVLWIRDRDALPSESPRRETVKFKATVEGAGQKCHILSRREIEYYIPEAALLAAQGADDQRKARAKGCLAGDQSAKLSELATSNDFQIPGGNALRKLLTEHLVESDLADIGTLVGTFLLPWKRVIAGEVSPD